MARRSRLLALGGVLVLSGCAVGKNYERPEMPGPAQHRFLEGPAQAESIADLPWWEFTKDPQLQSLIREAIAGNLDLRVATARVQEARAIAGVAKSFLYPEVGVGASYTTEGVSRETDPPSTFSGDRSRQNWTAGFTLSWEIDLFGRIRREKEAAFARYLATEQGRRAAVITLVGDVGSLYYQLRQLDAQLEIARRTVASNDETVAYYQKRLKGGVSNHLELDQAVANRSRTAVRIPEFQRNIAITEDALSVLLGRVPGPIERSKPLSEQEIPPSVPAGLPAALLERRPDVVAAEEQLVAANADVGAAKALFFPTLSLTGFFGGVSHDLSNLLRTSARVWNITPGLFQPLFQGGRIRRNYEAAQARFDQAVAQYRKSALDAYREVADSLVTLQTFGAQRTELENGVVALQSAAKLSRSRYDAGLANYLEILIADENLFDQEILLAQTRGEEMRSYIQLYRALGGGWPAEAGANPPAPETPTPPAAPVTSSP